MKRWIALLGLICILLCGCTAPEKSAQIAATTLPVYEFTSRLCDGTGITVTRLVTENVSCLHDYALRVDQVKATESAELVVLSGAGLEEFLSDILGSKAHIDASAGIDLLESCHDHEHAHEHEDVHAHEHEHEYDAHIWLSPENALKMAENICAGLAQKYPDHSHVFEENLLQLRQEILDVREYADRQLSHLACREIITFHDGFQYLAEAFDLQIVHAIEEESGSEASAGELIEIIHLVRQHRLPAIFTEKNGSGSAAGIIAAETGSEVFALDMAMSTDGWFAAMYHNIDTLKEALE